MKKDFFTRLGRFIGSVAAVTIFLSIAAIIGVLAIKLILWIWFL